MADVLLVQVDPATQRPLSQALDGMADTRVQIVADPAALTALVSREPAPEAVVIGPAVLNPLQTAQRLHAAHPRLLVFILVRAGEAGPVGRAIQFAPYLSDTVTCHPADDAAALGATLRQAVEQSRRRRQYSSTINALNARLAAAAPAPAHAIRYLDRVLELAPIGILVLDAEDRVQVWNQAARRIFGVNEREAIGHPVVQLVQHRARRHLTALLARARTRPERPARARLSHATRGRHPRWLQVTAACVAGPAEESGLLLLCDEVTKRVRAEQARAAALEEARAALALRDAFFSVAAHELRTPLTPLRGTLQLLRRQLARGMPAQVLVPYVDRADAQVERLIRLVGNLLDTSRLGTAKSEVVREPVDLGSLVTQVVDLERAAMEPPRTINLRAPEFGPVVRGDAGQLEQVLVNLLENARKYSPAQTPIEVTATTEGDTAVVSVRDEGIGIPPADQPRIFDRFHRGANIDRSVSGFGLGLHIAHDIVVAHGGTLSVHSEPGAGSTFTVCLPQGDAGAG